MPYGVPPVHSQWGPGESGNWRGRPPGARGRKPILERIAHELCEVKIGGKMVFMTKLEVVLVAIRNATANGNPGAQRLYDRLLDEASVDEDLDPPVPLGVLIFGERLTEQEWETECAQLRGDGPPPPCRKRGLVFE